MGKAKAQGLPKGYRSPGLSPRRVNIRDNIQDHTLDKNHGQIARYGYEITMARCN